MLLLDPLCPDSRSTVDCEAQLNLCFIGAVYVVLTLRQSLEVRDVCSLM